MSEEEPKKESVWDIVDRIADEVLDEAEKKPPQHFCIFHGRHNNLLTITTDLETPYVRVRIFCLYCLCRMLAGIEMEPAIAEAFPTEKLPTLDGGAGGRKEEDPQ